MTYWNVDDLPKPSNSLERLQIDLDHYGYCLIANAIDRNGLREVQHRLEAQARAEREQGHHRFSEVQDPGGVNQWVYMLINKGRAFQHLLFQPQVMALLEHLLGPGYVLSDFSAHITRPGNSLLPLHIDQWWLPPPRLPDQPHIRPATIRRGNVITEEGPPKPSLQPINPPVVVNAMWMISDYTQENGATRVVPGSHLSGAQPDQNVPHSTPSVPAEGPAGSIILWDGRTWHSAGANHGTESRFGVTTYFSGPQFRSLSNFTLGTKPEVLADASPELLQLLGFRPFGGYGHTGQDSDSFARPASELIGELE